MLAYLSVKTLWKLDTPAESEPQLSDEQQRVVDRVVQGQNMFYTGSAGTGKSAVHKSFVKQLESDGKKVHILAPTKLAAHMVNGHSIWSYAGWTPSTIKKTLRGLEVACNGTLAWDRFI
jgi:ATP-dependent DNA helicase PIF1